MIKWIFMTAVFLGSCQTRDGRESALKDAPANREQCGKRMGSNYNLPVGNRERSANLQDRYDYCHTYVDSIREPPLIKW